MSAVVNYPASYWAFTLSLLNNSSGRFKGFRVMAFVLCTLLPTTQLLQGQDSSEQSTKVADRASTQRSISNPQVPPSSLSPNQPGFGGVVPATHLGVSTDAATDPGVGLQCFPIDALMKRAQLATGCPPNEAADQVVACIPTAYRFWEPQHAVAANDFQVVFGGGKSRGAAQARKERGQPPIVIKDQQLCVYGTPREHHLISRGLDFLETHGFSQLALEGEVYSFPDRYVNQFAEDLGQPPLQLDAGRPPVTPSLALARNRQTVMRALERVRKQKPKSFRLEAAPRFRAWNGLAVEMKFGQEQSFLTSYQQVQGEHGNLQLRPTHTKLLDGIALNLIATSRVPEDDPPKVSMQLGFHQSKVEDVTPFTYTVAGPNGPQKVTVEQPGLRKTGFHTTLSVDPDQLLIAILNDGPEADRTTVLVLDCRVIPSPAH